jgi:redox-sensitive bicupin YhaK (pirin superfamily)
VNSPLTSRADRTLATADRELDNVRFIDRQEISFDLPNGHYALAHVLEGGLRARSDGQEEQVRGEQALALYGSGGHVTFAASDPAHFLILSGAEVREPVVVDGNFINRAGAMGHLAPLS